MFVSFATMLIRSRAVVSSSTTYSWKPPRLQEFFNVLDAVPAVHDRDRNAIDPRPPAGAGRIQRRVVFSYGRQADRRSPTCPSPRCRARPSRLVGATGAGKSTAIALLHRAFDPQSVSSRSTAWTCAGLTLAGLRRNIGGGSRRRCCSNRSIARQPARRQAGRPPKRRCASPHAAPRRWISSSAASAAFETNAGGAAGRMLSGGEPQRLSIARRALEGSTDPDPRRGDLGLDAVTEAKVNAALDEVMKRPHHLRDRASASTHPQRHRILVFREPAA